MKTLLFPALLSLTTLGLISLVSPAHATPSASDRKFYWTSYPNPGSDAVFTPYYVEAQAIYFLDNPDNPNHTSSTVSTTGDWYSHSTNGSPDYYLVTPPTDYYSMPANLQVWNIVDFTLGGAPAQAPYGFRLDYSIGGVTVTGPTTPVSASHMYSGTEGSPKTKSDDLAALPYSN